MRSAMTAAYRQFCSEKEENIWEDVPIEIGWLERTIREKVDQVSSSLREWKANRIGEGQGFLSCLVRVQFVWEPNNHLLPNSVIAKVPTLDSFTPDVKADKQKTDESMGDEFLPMAHKTECSFYEMFGDGAPLPVAKTYYTRPMGETAGVIVMEDMTENTKMVNIADGLRLEQVLNVAEALASLHAYSLTHSG